MKLKFASKKAATLLTLSLTVLLGLAGCSPSAENTSTGGKQNGKVTVNIGIQQLYSPLWLARQNGWFEQAFSNAGAQVNWVEFQSGPPHFQSIASDRLDFGQVGNAPVIIGQAANVNYQEIALAGEGKKSDAILVPKGSPIHTIGDLKGKKVAVAKGSSGFNLLYQAIDAGGLKPADLNIIQLQPNEAKPAFDSHAVDAWAIWDPYITQEVQQQGATILINEEGLQEKSPVFTIVRSKFAKEHPDLVVLFLQVYQQSLDWQNQHVDEAANLYASTKKLEPSVARTVIQNAEAIHAPITPAIVASQQKTADFLFKLGAINQSVDVSKVVDNSFFEKAKQQPVR